MPNMPHLSDASHRRKTRTVWVGSVAVGSNYPIRVQSMTTSDTRDVKHTLEQIKRLIDVGCEIVRVTVQGKKEAYACEEIKNGLIQKGLNIPLVADIHFYPPAAMIVADFVDKVRINPGNYLDRRAVFKMLEYTDASYAQEKEKIHEGFSPLVKKCRERKIALRIGTNHGSLSDRIMSRYGDTPIGMVESALEYAKVCREHDFHNFLFSMKASNPKVMIEAYRMLAAKMDDLGWDYPLHLGVTEAGEGEDGRIKSAMGTGTLLLEGLGDTIRLSLTEDPWKEIAPSRKLIKAVENKRTASFPLTQKWPKPLTDSPLHQDGTVFLKVAPEDITSNHFYEDIGAKQQLGRPQKGKETADILVVSEEGKLSELKLRYCQEVGIAVMTEATANNYFVDISSGDPASIRKKIQSLREESPEKPIILRWQSSLEEEEEALINIALELGSLLCDGWGDGLFLDIPQPLQKRHEWSFRLLQAARMRSFRTEFIACPGCGRTLFDLQAVTQRIQKKTGHLPGVKIAIMGCIVNGPGEMADADFGYVGSRSGKVDLYVGKQCIERNIDHAKADEHLIALIKKHGRWIEPQLKSTD